MKRILVVDDANLIRTIAKKVGEAEGYQVITATDGAEGLEALNTEEKFDIVFTDMNMPVMNGMDFVENLKRNPENQFLPVVMLTTEDDKHLKAKGKEAGVSAWLIKPFNKEKFLLAIEKLTQH
jgi:two-component system chemotaxis response regulator CheY